MKIFTTSFWIFLAVALISLAAMTSDNKGPIVRPSVPTNVYVKSYNIYGEHRMLNMRDHMAQLANQGWIIKGITTVDASTTVVVIYEKY